MLLLPSSFTQIVALFIAGALGAVCLKFQVVTYKQHFAYCISRREAMIALSVLFALLFLLPLWASISHSSVVTMMASVYRAGALVFGGGHVVLPLLQPDAVSSGVISNNDFLAGYGAAQALPGPLFAFAAYLGAVAQWPMHGWLGGLLLVLCIFLPAGLVLIAVIPFWQLLQQHATVRAAMAGVNAGVVGILLAALYDPMWVSTIQTNIDTLIVLISFGLLMLFRKLPPITIVFATALAGWISRM